MRVGIFTDNDFGKINGVTTALRAVIEHAPPGIETRVYTCASSDAVAVDYRAFRAFGAPIPLYPEMRLYVPPLGRILRQVRSDRISVIHLTTPGPMGLAALWTSWRLDLPLIGSFHTDLVAYVRVLSGSAPLAALMQQYLRWPYGRCERILVPSDTSRRLISALKIPPDKVSVWRRGVSTTLFSPQKRSDALRHRWGASAACPVLLYAGRLSREKGLSALVSLERRLADLGVAHRLVLVGDGPMRDELTRALPEAVFMGTLDREDIAVAMASSDVFVFPSCTDTAGNVVLEAQASGLPVVVMDAGGPSENMDHGRTGFVCEDAARFEIAVISLLHSAVSRQVLSTGARAYAERRRWRSALAPLFRAYEELHHRREAVVAGAEAAVVR